MHFSDLSVGLKLSDSFSENRHKNSIVKVDKLLKIYQSLVGLTQIYNDSAGNAICLYKTPKHGLVGAVLDQRQKLTLIPGKNIQNPLNPRETPAMLVCRLENSCSTLWDIAYNAQLVTLTLWPHLEGAGKDNEVREIRVKGSPLRYTSEKELVNQLQRSGYIQKPGDKNAWINEKKGFQVHIDRKNEGNAKHDIDHVDMRFTQEKAREIKQKKEEFREKRIKDKHQEIDNRVKNGQISQRDGKKEKHQFEKNLDTQEGKFNQFRQKWRFAYGQERPKDPPGNKPGSNNPPGPKNPATKEFEQKLQQTKLTDSYNATHRQSPVQAKGGTGGEIGGVACGTDYIEGLFDSPEDLFDQEHFFCMPTTSDGKMPFTNGELKQIMRELAIGIYEHSTIPFFSLHFNQNSDQFPVIHPAYENTLVGRVISLLDYFMKGYLNGGVFTESFIDQWHKDPRWENKSSSALQQLIDFGDYCQKNLKGEDQKYQSLRMLQQELGIALDDVLGDIGEMLSLNEESSILRNFEGVQTSFRIIAKQNSIQKEGPVFILDSDFDVFHTLHPSPEFKEALEQHSRKTGKLPSSYKNLELANELIKKRIHEHMVKMPLCQNYFAMLSVINFFSGYFSTLKKHRKIPVLSAFELTNNRGCPPLFPHLPIKTQSKEILKYNPSLLFKKIIGVNHYKLESFLALLLSDIIKSRTSISLDKYNPSGKKELEAIFISCMKEHVLGSSSLAFQRHVETSPDELIELTVSLATNQLDNILESFKKFIEEIKHDIHKYDQKKLVPVFFELVSKNIESKTIKLPPISFSLARIKEEATSSEISRGKKIVGGCGMDLKVQSVEGSDKARDLLHHNYSKMMALEPESWTEVSLDSEKKSKGFIFRLFHEDVPAWIQDDYVWMESLLFKSKDENEDLIEARIKIIDAIFSEDKETFSLLINETKDLDKIYDKEQRSLMHHAATMLNPFYVKTLLSKGLSISKEDAYGFLPIHYAAMVGAIESMELLMKSGNNNLTDARSHQDSTPLMVAIQHNQLEAVCWLLKQNVSLTSSSGGYNSLHYALHQGNKDVIHIILDHLNMNSSILNELSEEGGTPLMMACELDDEKLIEKMIEKGADPSLKRKDGMTALQIVILRNYEPILKCLLKKVAPTGYAIEAAVNGSPVEIVELLNGDNRIFAYKNSCEDTALHIAIRQANTPVALYIIEKCQNTPYLSAQNINEETAFSLAAILGFWEILNALMEKGVTPTFNHLKLLLRYEYNPLVKKIINQLNLGSQELQELLLIAAQTGNNLAISDALVPKGIQLEEFKGPNAWKMTHYLAKSDGIYLFKRLISNEKDILQPLESGKTLPYIAAENGSLRVLKTLLGLMRDGKVSLDKHYQERHLLYAAIESGKEECVEVVLGIFKDINLNIPIGENKTYPLHVAAKLGSKNLIKFLISKGANIDIKDKDQMTPLYYVLRAGGKDLALSLIKEFQASITPHALFSAAQMDEEIFSELVRIAPKCLDAALLVAVYNYDKDAFIRILSAGASCNYISKSGWSPLLYTSATGQHEILAILLQETSLKKSTFAGNNNALHLAVKNKHPQCILLLLGAGLEDVKNDEGRTPLDLAKGNVTIETLLKSKQIPFEQETANLVKAIIRIKSLKQEEGLVMNMLKELGEEILPKKLAQSFRVDLSDLNRSIQSLPFDQTLQFTLTDPYGVVMQKTWTSLLHFLIEMSQAVDIKSSIQSILRTPNLKLSKQDSEGNTLVHHLVKTEIPFNIELNDLKIQNHQGETPLHVAASHAEPEVLEALLKSAKSTDLINMPNRFGETPIFNAIKKNKEKNILLLIKYGANLNHRSHALLTPLLLSCHMGVLHVFKILIQKGADINQEGTLRKITPLYLSIREENDEMIRQLLFNGVNCNALSDEGVHPLHLAALTENTALFRLLAAKGLSLNIKDKKGFLPIHYAIEGGKKKILSTILSVDPEALNRSIEPETSNQKEQPTLFDGATNLHLSASLGHLEITKYFLDQNVDTEALTKDQLSSLFFAGQSPSKSMLELFSPYKLSKNPENLCQALTGAIARDNLDNVIALYKKGMPIDGELAKGVTGLHFASKSGALLCTQWLLQKGADPYAMTSHGDNAFTLSAANESYEQFNLLLEFAEPDLDKAYGLGARLLHISAKAGQLKHVVLLIKLGASLDLVDDRGNTALHYAVKGKHHSIVGILLACGGTLTAKNGRGESALDLLQPEDNETKKAINSYLKAQKESKEGDSLLHLAVRCGNSLAVLLLSSLGDIDQKNSDGFSPLHLAAQTKQIKTIRYLLRAGANIDLADVQGKTPLWYACITDFATAEFLIAAEANCSVNDKTGTSLIECINRSNVAWKNQLLSILNKEVKTK